MKTATGDSVLRAYSKAVKNLTTYRKMLGSEVSAGFIIPDSGRAGYQVSVKVSRFCKELLKKHPDTGGIIANFKKVFKKAAPAKILKEPASAIKKLFRKPTKRYLTKLFPMRACRGPMHPQRTMFKKQK